MRNAALHTMEDLLVNFDWHSMVSPKVLLLTKSVTKSVILAAKAATKSTVVTEADTGAEQALSCWSCVSRGESRGWWTTFAGWAVCRRDSGNCSGVFVHWPPRPCRHCNDRCSLVYCIPISIPFPLQFASQCEPRSETRICSQRHRLWLCMLQENLSARYFVPRLCTA